MPVVRQAVTVSMEKTDLASNSLLESLVFARRAADDILFGTKTEFRCTQVDIRQYEDREQILSNIMPQYEMK